MCLTSGIFSSMILMTASMLVFLFKMTSIFWDTKSGKNRKKKKEKNLGLCLLYEQHVKIIVPSSHSWIILFLVGKLMLQISLEA